MLVVMSSHATQEQIDQVLAAIQRMNLSRIRCPAQRGRRSASPATTRRSMPARSRCCRACSRLSASPSRTSSPVARCTRPTRIVRCRRTTIGGRALHDHRRPVLGRERGDDPAHGRIPERPGCQLPARRRVQAAHQPLCLSGPGPGGTGDPPPGPREDRASASSPS